MKKADIRRVGTKSKSGFQHLSQDSVMSFGVHLAHLLAKCDIDEVLQLHQLTGVPPGPTVNGTLELFLKGTPIEFQRLSRHVLVIISNQVPFSACD